MYTHQKNYISAGAPAGKATGALIMLHGRGGSAADILGLAGELKNVNEFAVYAPQASKNSWYPHSFMAPDASNQPALNSALEVIGKVVEEILAAGIPAERIFFLGFSQGACLTLEYIARNAMRYGGAVAFTGGLIGEELNKSNYRGSFAGTPVLITTGDPDPHVPLARVEASVQQLQEQNANVKLQVYKGRPHTILRDELKLADEWVFGAQPPVL
ncbi:alpha/beta hydrolase [Mucilaginibacter xinganensis]|uniref:Phospholipase/carboxylesterase n=1 Tax=Mucilaginibacter xinganensis TaxID=1234841 RepID=A0A223NT89_9SPHI|nr:dienelactone hydrolase family protein [Mucilaginibacter xinganensis]ASU33119.1 phospholipase/carboxylesterase [Mucilaginibacter xinganensis]